MAKVKILLDKNETIEDIEESLFKALDFHRQGGVHTEEFADPAMSDLNDQLVVEHEKMLAAMLEEIFNELDKEYSDGNI